MRVSEKYRPLFHFAPEAGWMNDPNGLIVIDDTYHLFFQHDPASTFHGTMHWGHAKSRDLLQWEERPIALYPTELGSCFSGSAIETEVGEVRLLYTAHRSTAEGAVETQALVFADRALERFQRYPSNPVIANPGLTNFRDPKVIWHGPTERWIMLLTHGQAIGFYASSDLIDWIPLSTFGDKEGRHGPGPWECPDMIVLDGPDGNTYWVVLVGIGADAYAPGSGTQYFVGTFDGERFHNGNPPDRALWLDHGRDHYATQTFFDRAGGQAIAMSWASNGRYAQQTPTIAFRGAMTLPRALRLVDTPHGLRVAASLPGAVAQQIPPLSERGSGQLDVSQSLAVGEEASIALFGEAAPHIVIRRTSEDRGFIRSIRQARDDLPDFGHNYDVNVDWPPSGTLDVTLYVDRGIVELTAASGQVWITNLYFPENPDGPARVAFSGPPGLHYLDA